MFLLHLPSQVQKVAYVLVCKTVHNMQCQLFNLAELGLKNFTEFIVCKMYK